jgi:hypothetical protein
MNRKNGLLTAAIMLFAIFVTFTCLSCAAFDSGRSFESLKKARVPIYLPELEPTTSTQDYKVALNFGIAITDALACIYNEDQTALPRYIGMVYGDGKQLGIPDPVLHQLGGITAAMDQGDWQKVLQLSNKFLDNVSDAIEKANKADEFRLAVMSWNLEGFYITVKSVNNHFSPASAKLLRDTNFVKDQEMVFKSLSVGIQAKKEVKAIMAALPKIGQLIDRPADYTYTQTDVKELISICEPLRQTLLSD